VEREGISFSHPARFILIGTMNPEEGDLRPQLLDRFALCVDMQGIRNPAARMAIMERNLACEANPDEFCEEWAAKEQALSEEIARARHLLPEVKYTQSDLATIATMMSELGVDGHRADLVVLKAARAHAAFEERLRLNDRDILLAAELALPHRLKRHPLQKVETTLGDISARLSEARAQAEPDGNDQGEDKEEKPAEVVDKKKVHPGRGVKMTPLPKEGT
jgi:Mg-chelatase subunit ChlI